MDDVVEIWYKFQKTMPIIKKPTYKWSLKNPGPLSGPG
tara:strand:+ start:409 stop:522 length:114 start_codon:yes stop_codon:yes gene_type:complete